jgi:hypothetical protein
LLPMKATGYGLTAIPEYEWVCEYTTNGREIASVIFTSVNRKTQTPY